MLFLLFNYEALLEVFFLSEYAFTKYYRSITKDISFSYDQNIVIYRLRRISWKYFEVSRIPLFTKQFPLSISFWNLPGQYFRLFSDRINIRFLRTKLPLNEWMEDVSCSWLLRRIHHFLNFCKRKSCAFKGW